MHRLTRHLALAVVSLVALGAAPAAWPDHARTVGVEQAREAVRDGSMILVDIRTPGEWRESGIPDVAVALDMRRRDFVQALLALRESSPQARLGLICATGGRSGDVAHWLVRNGVDGVVDVSPGVHSRDGWLAQALPVRAPEAPPASP